MVARACDVELFLTGEFASEASCDETMGIVQRTITLRLFACFGLLFSESFRIE